MSVPETHSRLKIFERLCEDDVEDSVRPAALLVHVGSSDRPGLVALRHQRLNVLPEWRKSNELPFFPSILRGLAQKSWN